MTNEQPAAALDNLFQALKVNLISNQEYLLQGSCLDSAVQRVLHRLKGLCDNVETAPEQFAEYEACFSLRNPIQSTEQLQSQQQAPILLRLRKLNEGPNQLPYQLRYIGNPELGDAKRATIVRTCFDVSCSPTIMEFLDAMGCRLEFEYNIRGYLFRKGRMKITVSKIFKVPMEAISQSYLVEMSVLAPPGGDAIGEEMRVFAEKLKPLVHFEKIDYKRNT